MLPIYEQNLRRITTLLYQKQLLRFPEQVVPLNVILSPKKVDQKTMTKLENDLGTFSHFITSLFDQRTQVLDYFQDFVSHDELVSTLLQIIQRSK